MLRKSEEELEAHKQQSAKMEEQLRCENEQLKQKLEEIRVSFVYFKQSSLLWLFLMVVILGSITASTFQSNSKTERKNAVNRRK